MKSFDWRADTYKCKFVRLSPGCFTSVNAVLPDHVTGFTHPCLFCGGQWLLKVQLNQIGANIPAEGARPALGIFPPLGNRLGYRLDAQPHGLHYGCDVGAKRTASARSGALGVPHGLAQAQGAAAMPLPGGT